MKYIPTDKLIAEVERRKEKWLAESRLIRKGKDKAMYAAGKSSGYTEFLSLIDSLQQEQPKDKQIVIITESHGDANIEWDCRSLDDAIALLKSAESFIAEKQIEKIAGPGSGPDYATTEGRYSHLFKRQQEQPEGLHFTPLNRLIQKIPSENWNDTVNNYAKKLRDCLIKEGYRKDAEVLQGYISYMNGNNVPMATMDEQERPQVADASKMEQPEVDLEKEIENEWRKCHPTDEGMGLESANIVNEQFDTIAKYFYELGRNARKL